MHCKGFFWHILGFSLLNGIGQLFIYRMIIEFRQHIPSFVIAVRKCLTVVINLAFFGHKINKFQMGGIFIVFSAVIWEVINNNLSKK